MFIFYVQTRVLVTHGVQWLPHVDQIIVLRHGRVSEAGTYDQLLSHNGPFAKFIKNYLVHPSTVHDPQGNHNIFRNIELMLYLDEQNCLINKMCDRAYLNQFTNIQIPIHETAIT